MLSIVQNDMMNITRIVYPLLFLLLLTGCASEVIRTPEFVFVTPDKEDTLESLAQQHLGTPSMAWKIQESNDIDTITPGEEIIIPTKPIRPGGLTAEGYQVIPVLSYHAFTRGRGTNLLTVSGKNFNSQLSYLKKEKFHTLTLDQLQDFLDLGQVPRNSVMLTIDDGWISSYKVAYPMLQEFGFNATLFIPSNYINSHSKKIINWAQIREMVNDKSIDIQCHTKGHRDLNLTESGESLQSYITSVQDQVIDSRKMIKDKIGKEVTALAYPYGNTNPVVIEILKNNGYKTAFTVKRDSNPFFTHNFLLNRSMIYGTYNKNKFIKNISVFNELSLDNPEPIDNLTDIRKISYMKASKYEEKEQWRTALLAWKMQRDRLLTAKSDWKSTFASQDDLLKKSDKKVAELNKKNKSIAQKHYLAAIESRNNKIIRKQLLRTLLYDPDHQDALAMLKNMPLKRQLSQYKVKPNETFETISRKLYNTRNNGVLIPLFNNSIKDDSDLVPGAKLVLPTVTAMNTIKPAENIRCQVKLTKPSSQVAKDLYTEANVFFNQDKIGAAIDKLKKAICLNPNYDIAKEMLEMLSGL
jgi:peptidoglycan/xylan/chitin deacetylase (PgdA/CDA1 family)